ncbi:MAG: hypothetical protein B7Z78_01460 [Rhodospirillales bacterium 20-60-12]|nr:MAG: hypothetical protein B7Z78_01460 [Rhodospirillales bacterium 20-60-12]HQT68703.1 hypothetical protein [Acetobacteraceae bacterium]
MSLCANCHAPAPPPFRPPPAELAPDLDMRPGEPTRSTMGKWVQICRSCAAAGEDLAQLPPSAAATVASPAYQALAGLPPLLRGITQAAMIENEAGNPIAAGALLIRLAWLADDANERDDATRYRRQTAALWNGTDDPQIRIRLIDILRRAGDFEQAAEILRGFNAGNMDDMSRQILRFQHGRIEASDTDRYQLSSALRPPARTPHVSHKQAAAKPGLFSRIFRR